MANTTNTTSYLDPPSLIGRLNNDGTISLTPLELKRLNDFNYAVSKMIQGGLNLANLNEDTQTVFNEKVTFTDLSDPTKSTVINGSHITTGTISADRVSGGTLEGVTLVSNGTGATITVSDGSISFSGGGGSAKLTQTSREGLYIEAGSVTGQGINISADSFNVSAANGGISLSSPVYISDNLTVAQNIKSNGAMKLDAGGDASFDAGGTLYFQTNGGDINIGNGGNIRLNGTVTVNGNPI